MRTPQPVLARLFTAGLAALMFNACAEADTESSSGGDPDAARGPDACCDAPTPDAGPTPDARVPGADAAMRPDAGDPAADAGAAPDPDAAVAEPDAAVEGRRDQDLPGGDAAGVWCGNITLRATVTVPAGQVLTVCAGSEVRATGGGATALVVLGTLQIRGTDEAPVRLLADGAWRGLRVGGVLDAEHFEVSGAANGIEGAPGGQIDVRHARIAECDRGITLADGGRFAYTTVLGGSAIQVSGGVLQMTDSVIDLQHPTRSPDCTNFDGGGATLDHVRFTGCHCPLHINAAPDGVRISASIFDGATNPVMIAQTEADLRGNHFEGTDAHLLDIGGGFRADITGSYFGGGAPRLSSRNQAQFVGAAAFSATPIPGVGPR